MLVFILLWALCVAVDGNQYRFDYSYSERAGGWLKVHKIPATWEEARTRCFLEGGVLASPSNLNMTAAMIGFMSVAGLRSPCGVFTGINARFSQGDYYSIEGEPLSRMPVEWMESEPDNCNNEESCIALDLSGAIADVDCSLVLPYICYKRAGKVVPLNECGTPDKEYKLFPKTGHCYKFHTQARNWSSAFMACSAEGGYLAIPNDKVEAMYLRDLFKQNLNRAAITTKYKKTMFLGFLDIEKRGVWYNIHGAPLESGYAEWESNQPEGKDGKTPFGAMFQDGLLDDVAYHAEPFVCEKEVDSLL